MLSAPLRTVLMTNSADRRIDGKPFDRVVRVDLLRLSGLGVMRGVARSPRTSTDSRAACGLKMHALLHGWAASPALLPDQVLLLDHDVAVLRPRVLLRMFDPLQHYDLAGVMEGMSRGWDGSDPNARNDTLASAPDPAGRGWELNTGVIAVRREARWLVELWAAEFAAGLGLYRHLTGVDQSALMWVLAHEPRARFFPMPPSFNFRAPAMYSRDFGAPAAFHSRTVVRGAGGTRAATAKAMMRVVGSVGEAAAASIKRAAAR